MKINTENWNWFLLDDYFDIKAGNYYYSYEFAEGNTPYVSATNINNGVSEYIDIKPDFPGNCIVTGKIGSTAFYQSEPFCATSDVNVFLPKFNFSQAIGLFLVTVINYSENYKWSYGRQCRVGDSKKIKVKLPTIDDEPDWKWMEEFITSLNYKPVITSNKLDDVLPIGREIPKREFIFGNLVDSIYKGYSHIKYKMPQVDSSHENSIPYVSRTSQNNSVDFFTDYRFVEKIEEGNCITIGDTTATIAYQSKKFVTGDHMVIIRADWINKYTGLFITTLLRHEAYRYSYGRAFVKDLITNTSLPLPVDKEGLPNWEYMEDFIKSMPYGDRV